MKAVSEVGQRVSHIMSTTSWSRWLLLMAMVGALITGSITVYNCSYIYDFVDTFVGRSDAEKITI